MQRMLSKYIPTRLASESIAIMTLPFRSRIEDLMVFSCFGFGEVADLDELKGGERRPSGLMTLKSKTAEAFFFSFGSDDPQHKEEVFLKVIEYIIR